LSVDHAFRAALFACANKAEGCEKSEKPYGVEPKSYWRTLRVDPPKSDITFALDPGPEAHGSDPEN